MKTTLLTDVHIALGAKMAEFAGYNMPISYDGINDEHEAVRKNVGVFDVSHMGEFMVKGKEALQLVQFVTSNNASKLAIGDAQYSCLPNGKGGIVDDLLVYKMPCQDCNEGEDAFLLVVNAGNIQKDWDWINAHNTFDCKLTNISDKTGLLAIQGPNTSKVLQKLTDIDLDSIKYYTSKKGTFAGIPNTLISATGYTGAGGFEIYVDNEHLKTLWDAVFDAGKDMDIKPIGLGARDTLRLEMGFALYGNDISDTTSPIEAGLSWITKVKKGDFIGQPLFAKQKAEGVTKKLVAFVVDNRRVPRHGYPILNEAGDAIGEVTSGTMAPSLGYPIGMGYVAIEHAKVGTKIQIQVRNKTMNAEVVKLPFYKG